MSTFNDWASSGSLSLGSILAAPGAFSSGLTGFPIARQRCMECHFGGTPAHAAACSMCHAPIFGIDNSYETGGDALAASFASVTLDARTYETRAPLPALGAFLPYTTENSASASNALLDMTGAWGALGGGGTININSHQARNNAPVAAASPWAGAVGRPYLDNEGGGRGNGAFLRRSE